MRVFCFFFSLFVGVGVGVDVDVDVGDVVVVVSWFCHSTTRPSLAGSSSEEWCTTSPSFWRIIQVATTFSRVRNTQQKKKKELSFFCESQ